MVDRRRIAEPMTAATDYALGLAALAWAVRLVAVAKQGGQGALWLWGAGFLASSAGAFLGGTSHGLAPLLEQRPWLKALVWKASLYSTALASALLTAGVIRATLSAPTQQWLLFLVALKAGAFALWMFRHDDFRFVVYDGAVSMLAVLALAARGWPDAWGAWIVGGVTVSFGAAAVQRRGRGLHRKFNHNDLYHTIQLAALFLLYRGGLLLMDR